jgi:hypothetical protein
MIRVIVLAMVLAAISTQALPFKFIGPNGYMEASDEDIARRKAEEKARLDLERQRAEAARAWADEQARIQEHNAKMNAMYRASRPAEAQPHVCPPRNKYNDGPRPGGHRRHIWREKTGFNTPAERTRYRMEIQRLKRKLQKEKSKPSPSGATPREIRKELGR